jgi:hypothetical protein
MDLLLPSNSVESYGIHPLIEGLSDILNREHQAKALESHVVGQDFSGI